jgi:hypothetical protein
VAVGATGEVEDAAALKFRGSKSVTFLGQSRKCSEGQEHERVAANTQSAIKRHGVFISQAGRG